MSRHPVKTVCKKQEIYTEQYIQFVTNHVVPKAMTRNTIASETIKDGTSNLLKEAILKNDWDHPAITKFRRIKLNFLLYQMESF